MMLCNGNLRWLAVLALILCGCAGSSWQGPMPARLVPKPASQATGPPMPAAALYIPGDPQPQAFAEPIIQKVSAAAPVALDSGVVALPALVPTPAQEKKQLDAATQDPSAKIRALHHQAVERNATMDSYILRLRRREVVNGKKRPEEEILFKFRREPFSVYLKWLGSEAHNREVIYVKGRYDDLLHTRLAAHDIPLVPAGKRFSMSPTNPLVKSNSRHPITEAGFANLIDQFGRLLDAVDNGDARLGTVRYLGLLKRPEFETPVEGVVQTLPGGSDPLLPGGGERLWFFDTNLHLPVLVITHDDTRQEVEYYCHDQIRSPAGLADGDFNPDQLWGK